MAHSISQQEAKVSLSRLFHSQFVEICANRLQTDEYIFATADCSVGDGVFGFIIITNYRAILVVYKASLLKFRKQIKYDKPFAWIPFPDAPLTQGEIDSREIKEALLASLSHIERTEYNVDYKNKQYQLISLFYNPGAHWLLYRTVFLREDGQQIYDLLLTAMRQRGTLS